MRTTTIINKKKSIPSALGAGLAAAVVPALLFLGAGTAHAGSVTTSPDPFGVTVWVQSTGEHGMCTYTALPVNGFGIPPAPRQFFLHNGAREPLWFPGIPTFATWQVDVDCGPGGHITQNVRY